VYPQLSNNALLQLTGKKDLAAFNELYFRLAGDLLETAFQKTSDRPQSQDLVQELFIWLWEQAETIDDTSLDEFDIQGYLHVALRNKIYNYYHRNLRVAAAATELQRVAVTAEEHTLRRMEYKDLESAVQAEIEALPTEMKKIFRLRRQEELSISQIAQELVLSEQTVKNQLGIATRRLRTSLQKAFIVTVILIQIPLWYFSFLPLLIV
jgi:RNA polymerase sigma-70 factor (ECF subfamily)